MMNENACWGMEIELFNGRCVYVAAEQVKLSRSTVHIKISQNNIIAIPKSNVRKMLVMHSNED